MILLSVHGGEFVRQYLFFFPVEFDNVFFGDMVSKNIFAPVVCACIGNNFY
jgi:hypothetical protein